MIDGSANAPVLVLGLGNLILTDDGAGLRLLQSVETGAVWGDQVEFIDGGTQGLALLGYLTRRRLAVVLVDRRAQPLAVGGGAAAAQRQRTRRVRCYSRLPGYQKSGNYHSELVP